MIFCKAGLISLDICLPDGFDFLPLDRFSAASAFARILDMPDETFTIHLLWRTLAINSCSAYVRFCNSTGISPIQIPFAKARFGILFLSRDSTHMGQTLLQPGAKMGPLNSLTGSELLDLAFLVTASTFHKQESTSHKQRNQPLQISREKCQHRNPTRSFDIIPKMVDLAETSHPFLTNSVSSINIYCYLYIQMLDNGARGTQHVYIYSFRTKSVDAQHWKLFYMA